MKKYLLLGLLSFTFIGLLIGCDSNKDDKDTSDKKEIKTITWQTRRDLSDYQDYFNQILKEKGYPYQVEFSTKEENKKVDILDIGSNLWKKTYNDIKPIVDKKVIPLDSYFQTKEGKKLKATLPQNVWDAYKVNGKQYGVLSTGYAPFQTAYIWDKTLADKYQIHPETWTEEIWKYKEDLEKVYNGENKNNFLTTAYLWKTLSCPLEYTYVLGHCYPLVINEKEDLTTAQFLYDSEKYRENVKGISSLYNAGLYSPEQETALDNPKIFLEASSTFVSKEAYAFQIGDEHFWETHEAKILKEEPLWKLTCSAVETGISSECPYPEDAFRLLCAVYTDKDLTNAILWGEKNVHFNVNGNFAVELGTKNRNAINNHLGNPLIGYTEVGQDPNRETLYPERMKNATPSKLLGFNFIGKNCTTELENIFQVWYKDYSALVTNPANSLLEQGNLRQQYKNAGIDKVIAEWNREFQEWRETQKAR